MAKELKTARPFPLNDPLDDTDEDGYEQTNEGDTDGDPILGKKPRRPKGKKKPKEQNDGAYTA